MADYIDPSVDHGKKPYVIDIEKETVGNDLFRKTIWTGAHLQATLMTIPVGGDIGLEVHEENDQFLRLEQGKGRCQMGPSKDDLSFDEEVEDDWAIFVPAGTWHNVTNIGDEPMKLYAIYGPADHEPGTVHKTQEDAENDPHEH
ncbi:Mannose-6-phosphate isomerase, cupin superfamily [Bowdeniella nasicola]|uniref:Mannose-6-phosphate isomerase, cupin superfamily n=1 Tax=Bowdeniella nasicola TaxID=208480 RepID=A0A1H3ZP27_9ACTO|nr:MULTISPECIES: cupin domain-containing protein [Bowdeniella]SEA25004.1 Mannose-6-phosphate isomerase, cupin superfamily [Bowdeniella nasicola]